MSKILRTIFFSVVMYLLTYFLYVYPFDIYTSWYMQEELNFSLSIIYTTFAFVCINIYYYSKISFSLLRFFIYEGMGIGFIAFCLINIILLLNLFIPLEDNFKAIIFISTLIFLLIIGYISSYMIKIKKITIQSEKIKISKKIVFISDIHLGSNSISHFKRILSKIVNIKPKIILIGGDLIDSSSFEVKKLEILKNIKTPIYFVTGNHEYYIKNSEEKIDKLKNFNINVLDNSSTQLEELNIIGLSDNISLNEQEMMYSKLKTKNAFNLSLVHKPSLWKKIYKDCDLMLSGHTHNGQIFPFSFLVLLQFKEKYGLYSRLKSFLYVSSGAGTWGPKIRLGSFNEIVSISIDKS